MLSWVNFSLRTKMTVEVHVETTLTITKDEWEFEWQSGTRDLYITHCGKLIGCISDRATTALKELLDKIDDLA